MKDIQIMELNFMTKAFSQKQNKFLSLKIKYFLKEDSKEIPYIINHLFQEKHKNLNNTDLKEN